MLTPPSLCFFLPFSISFSSFNSNGTLGYVEAAVAAGNSLLLSLCIYNLPRGSVALFLSLFFVFVRLDELDAFPAAGVHRRRVVTWKSSTSLARPIFLAPGAFNWIVVADDSIRSGRAHTPRTASFVASIEISFVRWVIHVAVSFETGAYARNVGLIGRRKNDDRLERGLGVFIGIRNAVESATAAPVVRPKCYELFSRNCRKYQPTVYIATLCINVHVRPTSSFPCLRSCVSIVNVARRTHRTRKATLLIAIQEFGNLRDEFPSLNAHEERSSVCLRRYDSVVSFFVTILKAT